MILVVIKMILSGIAALAVLYLLAIMPRMIRRPDTSLFKKVYFAHRGLHDNAGDAPENSMAAFKKAVEAGLGMELDVQVTKDGVPVIFHDFKLERICGAEGKIVNHTYDELQAYTLCQSQERIPKLSELLEMVDGRVPLIVEIKAETADVSCCVIIDKLLHAYRGAYCIESFNPMVLWWFRRKPRKRGAGTALLELPQRGRILEYSLFCDDPSAVQFSDQAGFYCLQPQVQRGAGKKDM